MALALSAEARDAGIDVVPSALRRAVQISQDALDFTFLIDRSFDVDAQWLDELRSHAEDAVQMGLLAIERAECAHGEEMNPQLQAGTLQALEEVFHTTARVLRWRLAGQSLEDARRRAREAVARAVACEARRSGLQLAPKELQQVLRRTHAALDSVTLAEPDACASGDFALLGLQALNALHLSLLGVSVSPQ